jgi:hypothetical protein
MRKVTTEEFKQAVFDMYGDEYTVIDEYCGFLKSINILHNKCGKVYKYSCGGRFLRGISKCPYCNIDQHVCLEKEKLANANGVKYIAVDMRYSTLDYCKNSIINSDFFSQFDLNEIDWDEADTFACKSIIVQIANDWNNGLCNVKEHAVKYHLSTTTIYKYLERANSLQLCSFDKKEYIHQTRKLSYVYSNNVKVKSVETGIIYNSIAEARRLAGRILQGRI